MFSTLGKIFGTDKALTGVVDHVASGLDALVYTDEERETDAAAERKAARLMVIEWMSTTKGQNLARRLIALSVTGVWLFQFVVSWLFELAAIFTNAATTERLEAAAIVTAERGESMIGAVMLILGFYFAAPHMGKMAEAAISRFGKAQSNG